MLILVRDVYVYLGILAGGRHTRGNLWQSVSGQVLV